MRFGYLIYFRIGCCNYLRSALFRGELEDTYILLLNDTMENWKQLQPYGLGYEIISYCTLYISYPNDTNLFCAPIPSTLKVHHRISQLIFTFRRYGGLLGSSSGFKVCLQSPHLRMLVASRASDSRAPFLMLMSRTLTALTATTSILVYGQLLSGSRIIFYLPWILKFPMPEIWRLATSFWLTGGGLSILFDTYFCRSFT